ncbi:MAG: hypothetical protein JNM10_16305, partial [Planctomycetia bacterium]|nr:hypothetical protein [Planctomycetia bacterium]
MARSVPTPAASRRRASLGGVGALVLGVVVACGGGGGGAGGGGGGGGGPPPPPPAVVPGLETPDLTAAPGASAGSVVLRFTAPTPQATAYVVRSRVRHLETPADVAAATVVPHGTTPGAPGAAETLVLTGLEPGQTLQFAVEVVRGATTAPFGFAVACRVPGGPPTPPGNAIALTGPATLSQDGATYLLTQDVTTGGTAFRITARDVVLDLGGRTVTYGTAAGTSYGVYSEFLYNTGTITVRNGRIVQGGANAAASHGVWFRGGHHLRIAWLDVTVRGDDTSGIVVGDGPTGDVRVDHNTVRCDTRVVTNRSYPGVAAIFVETVTKGVQLDHNLVLSSPQWGLKLQGNATTGEATVHHNRVLGTKALVANAYMFGLYKPSVDVFENEGAGESRGVHLDGVDGSGTSCRVHDNVLRVQDQPNDEYPDFHWVHGIKLEGASGTRIDRNLVVGTADATHGEVRALDLDLEGTTGVVIEQNRVHGLSTTPALRGHALEWSSGTVAAPNGVTLRRNVFRATDRLIDRAWGARRGGLLRDNVWVRDLSLGTAHPFLFEYFDNSDTLTSPEHRLLDPLTTEDLLAVDQWGGAGPYASTREWTLGVLAVDAGGAPVAGAAVTVRDKDGATAFTATTDAAGLASGTVVAHQVTNGPVANGRNPFSVSVNKAGVGGFVGQVTVDRRTMLRVDLPAGTATPDTTPPAAPTGVVALRVSASRVYVRWEPATDPSGIAGYLVALGGEPVLVSDVNDAFVAG